MIKELSVLNIESISRVDILNNGGTKSGIYGILNYVIFEYVKMYRYPKICLNTF